MNMRSLLKNLPCTAHIYHLLFARSAISYSYLFLSRLSNDELLSLMRHESHRIEKAVYNNILSEPEKSKAYQETRKRLGIIYKILNERGYPPDEPTVTWSRRIYDDFDNLETDFIQRNSLAAPDFDPNAAEPFIEFLRSRRSVRVWAKDQPDEHVLIRTAYDMINAARWAPNSGNRQAWRFLILREKKEKELLRHIKENHCTNAPLLVFVGMDTRLYGALGKSERSIFIDAGAAIMQMLLVAQKCGLGACWNHLADDLINSRKTNHRIYDRFSAYMNIPEYIAPIAIIAIGRPEFIPPRPARMEIEALMLRDAN